MFSKLEEGRFRFIAVNSDAEANDRYESEADCSNDLSEGPLRPRSGR